MKSRIVTSVIDELMISKPSRSEHSKKAATLVIASTISSCFAVAFFLNDKLRGRATGMESTALRSPVWLLKDSGSEKKVVVAPRRESAFSRREPFREPLPVVDGGDSGPESATSLAVEPLLIPSGSFLLRDRLRGRVLNVDASTTVESDSFLDKLRGRAMAGCASAVTAPTLSLTSSIVGYARVLLLRRPLREPPRSGERVPESRAESLLGPSSSKGGLLDICGKPSFSEASVCKVKLCTSGDVGRALDVELLFSLGLNEATYV
jgi:hypothetical protein